MRHLSVRLSKEKGNAHARVARGGFCKGTFSCSSVAGTLYARYIGSCVTREPVTQIGSPWMKNVRHGWYSISQNGTTQLGGNKDNNSTVLAAHRSKPHPVCLRTCHTFCSVWTCRTTALLRYNTKAETIRLAAKVYHTTTAAAVHLYYRRTVHLHEPHET